VTARACPEGHQNDVSSAFCVICGLAIGSNSSPASAPNVSGATASAEPAWPYPSPVPPTPATSKRRPLLWLIPVAALVVIGIVIAIVVNMGKNSTRTVEVKMDLYQDSDPCSVGLGYIDIPGGSVVLEADGVTVASGSLSALGTDMGNYCEFTAYLPSVPTDKSIYSVSVGNLVRGSVTDTHQELESNGWRFDLSLGQ